jgi:hypothetical protein
MTIFENPKSLFKPAQGEAKLSSHRICSVKSSTQRIIAVNSVIAQIGRMVMYWNKF